MTNNTTSILRISNHKKNILFLKSLQMINKTMAIRNIRMAGLDYLETNNNEDYFNAKGNNTIALLVNGEKIIDCRYCF